MDSLSQVTVSAAVVYVIELLKRSQRVPWITTQTRRINRAVSLVLSAATAVGITVHFDHGVLTVAGLTLGSILTFAFTWAKSFVLQELVYQTAANGK